MPMPNAIRNTCLLLAVVPVLAFASTREPVATRKPAATREPAATKDVPIPDKVPAPVDKNSAPTVNIRTADNGDVVEEYRQNGKVFMVRVTPKRGKPYYLYDDDRNGRLDRTDADKASVSPVYWTIYEWD
ncbi:hypothetical protein BH11PSE14_BH11PSE14_09670 [soil metagenome]